jgi:hypothetical protein
MITVSFNGTRESLVDVLPEGKKMESMYFTQSIDDPLAELCDLDSGEIHQRKFTLHLSELNLSNFTSTRTFTRRTFPTDEGTL